MPLTVNSAPALAYTRAHSRPAARLLRPPQLIVGAGGSVGGTWGVCTLQEPLKWELTVRTSVHLPVAASSFRTTVGNSDRG